MAITAEPLTNVPLSPAAPEDLYFSKEQGAWIISRHRDVLVALRSGNLSQARPPKAGAEPIVNSERERSCVAQANGWIHSEVFTALANAQTFKRQTEMNAWAAELLQRLPRDRPVDLVPQFIRPWCLDSALALTGIAFEHRPCLSDLVSRLSESDAAPGDADLKCKAKEANKELDHFFQARSTPFLKSVLLGVAQTLPAFLASAWVALLHNPSQRQKLQECPERLPKAIEELLRYAGPVHTLFRQAEKELHISGTRITCGDRLLLRLSSANRDPQQFAEPDRLDFTRDVAGHLALSAGSHYCPGAAIVRMATATAIQAFLDRSLAPELSDPVVWSCGTMLIWPSSVPVLLGGKPDHNVLY